MKWLRKGCFSALALTVLLFAAGATVRAEESDTIKRGILAGSVDLSGLTGQEAEAAVRAYVESLKDVEITLMTSGDTPITVTAGEFGLEWANTELVSEALAVGKSGNVIERYKVMKDLEHENLVYPIELSFGVKEIKAVLEEKCTGYDQEAKSWNLERVDGEFRIVDGHNGYALDIDASVEEVNRFLTEEWDYGAGTIALKVKEEEPKGSKEELEQVKDVLGSYTT